MFFILVKGFFFVKLLENFIVVGAFDIYFMGKISEKMF